MNALRGMVWLLVFQSVGELLARGLRLPLPGPVIGMVLLLVALRWPAVQKPVAECAEFLLSHLSLLFVPVGVGVMTHLSLVSQYGVRMLAVVVLSTLAGLGVTVLSLHLLRDRHPLDAASTPEKDGDA
jgi:holin-like protein